MNPQNPKLLINPQNPKLLKKNLQNTLKTHGKGMAGDGGNDCGGLRAAHAGLALSDAEASFSGCLGLP